MVVMIIQTRSSSTANYVGDAADSAELCHHEDRIQRMLSAGSLSGLYDEGKVNELENMEELTGKDAKKLEAYQNNKPVFDAILAALHAAVSDAVYLSPAAFAPILAQALGTVTQDKKLLEKIADG